MSSVHHYLKTVLLSGSGLCLLADSAFAEENNWWNKEWAQRQKITIDTTSAAASAKGEIGGATVLIRLFDGNFQFPLVLDGGADLRFVTEDGKTTLPYQVEKFDALLNEAFVWVKLPDVKGDAQSSFYVYYGNASATAEAVTVYDDKTSLVYHFAGVGAPSDATTNKNNATNAGIASEGALIGGGLRLGTGEPVTIPPSPSLEWKQGQAMTLTAWIKPSAFKANAVLLSRKEGSSSFRLLIDQGTPIVEINGGRSAAGAPIATGTWTHLAVVVDGGATKLLVNGVPYGTVAAGLPALNAAYLIGGATTDTDRFTGELDELSIASVARSEGWIKFVAVNQGATDAAQRALSLGEVETSEGGGEHGSQALEHVMLFGDIAKNMMFDGWIAIGICIIMIVVGWTVAARKFFYLNSIQKGTNEFLRLWKTLSSDLTALDHGNDESVTSLGGTASPQALAHVKKSPLYQIYHIGSEEIRHRLLRDKSRTQGLSARSMQAIRAALDAGLVRANHKLTNGLVYLTISIAGGPYVGLLGTVVGVMITFAIIAKSGEVDVNSIAPGIASALLATVAGLIVAIPALFIYSYLNSRIKNVTAEMQVFIDEFIAKMAEFYPPAGEGGTVTPMHGQAVHHAHPQQKIHSAVPVTADQS